MRFEFEVFGKVQGVWFRKYTKKKADSLKITGWVKNTDKGTVVGQACSTDSNKILEFKKFLCEEGSPKSRIDACDITDLNDGEDYKSFTIIR